ncbi:serine carboxypeptidase-like 8 isoform X2 [Nymphaea colorata]|uniref:serine carboxypeptidase-like 8 isoform X2 n=1 Tax=Nymphaea colorata TaxID=210225 RepID=UPI00129D52B2|nr:serine carboxypeptidase-like 8 isoform X2 [Nymphaea colorata]
MMMAQFCYSSVLSFACLFLLGGSRHASGEERVARLPGYDGDLPFEMYTGYITVNETTSNNIFYYFIKSERNSTTDPLIFWLTGGPGCSGFSGLVFEIGPVKFKVEEYNGSLPTLVYNPYSFTRIASIIFIDSPTFTGFSYSNSTDDHFTGNSKNFEEDYVFLKKWLGQHPEFQSNPLYIAGDSYAGMIIPALTYRIAKEMEDGTETIFNLKGYFEGNPTTDNNFDASAVPFVYGMSLIPTSLYEATKKCCNGQYYDPPNENCSSHLELIDELIAEVNQPHILEEYCGYIWSPQQRPRLASRRAVYEFESIHHYPSNIPPTSCREYGYYLCYIWANDETVREALHVRKGTVGEWQRCSKRFIYNKEWASVIHYHRALLSKGYPALFYSGDHDMVVSHVGTQGWISSLNFTVAEQWRPWFVENQVAGYTRKYAPKVTYATVKGAGHTAPEYRPKQCYHMYERWLSGQAL